MAVAVKDKIAFPNLLNNLHLLSMCSQYRAIFFAADTAGASSCCLLLPWLLLLSAAAMAAGCGC